MEPIDLVVLVLVGIGAYEGYKKGFLLSVIGIIGFVLAIILGVYFMTPVSKWLATRLDELTFAFPVVSFLIVFAITMLTVKTLGLILKKVTDMILLKSFDSLAGALFGILKTAFFISFFLWLALRFDLEIPKEWKKDSKTLQYIEPLTPGVIWLVQPFTPKITELEKTIGDIVDQFRDAAVD